MNELVVACKTLKHAMDGVGCNVIVCAETLIGRSNWEIHGIRYEYRNMYNEDLEKRLIKETGGDVEKFFVAILQGLRDETGSVGDVQIDVDVLYKAGQGRMMGNNTINY